MKIKNFFGACANTRLSNKQKITKLFKKTFILEMGIES